MELPCEGRSSHSGNTPLLLWSLMPGGSHRCIAAARPPNAASPPTKSRCTNEFGFLKSKVNCFKSFFLQASSGGSHLGWSESPGRCWRRDWGWCWTGQWDEAPKSDADCPEMRSEWTKVSRLSHHWVQQLINCWFFVQKQYYVHHLTNMLEQKTSEYSRRCWWRQSLDYDQVPESLPRYMFTIFTLGEKGLNDPGFNVVKGIIQMLNKLGGFFWPDSRCKKCSNHRGIKLLSGLTSTTWLKLSGQGGEQQPIETFVSVIQHSFRQWKRQHTFLLCYSLFLEFYCNIGLNAM